jgi:uncharacterized membrane protein
MIDILLMVVLIVLAARGFAALHRESAVRREFGQSHLLDVLVLLYPLGPLLLLIGPYFVPAASALFCAASLYVASIFVASKQRNSLECAGTDRVNRALEATSSATLGAIVGIVYVALVAIFVLLVHSLSSRQLGT